MMMTTSDKVTAETITADDIRELQQESSDRCDFAMVAICELALTGFAFEREELGRTGDNLAVAAETYPLTVSEVDSLRKQGFGAWCSQQAERAAIAAINAARAQEVM